MKKLLGLLLSASLLATSGIQVFAADAPSFTDISDEKYAWAKDYIEQMAKEGYIAGYEDNTYRPDNEVTRLETIVLFSRAMGSKRAENKEIVALAREQFEDVISDANINFGEDEVAYMLYRKVLTEKDVKIYLSNGKGSMPMPRQEAAAIITKAMCGEDDAKAEVLTDMEYIDAKEISSNYTQYVFYVSKNEIMNGMDDGSFSPASSVLRSQIAVMLYRAVDKMNLYIETVPVTDIDTEKNNISIVDLEYADLDVGYTDFTRFYIDGEISSEDDAVLDSDAMLTYINDALVFVDMKSIEKDETLRGVFQGSTTQAGKTTVSIKNVDNDEVKVYELAKKAQLYKEDGSSIPEVRNISLGSYVEFDIANDLIIKFSQIKKTSTIQDAYVESMDIEDELYLTISHDDKEYDGMRFKLNDDVNVYKNNDREDLSKIYKGDRINITMEYGIVTKLVATSNTKSYNGTISEVVISANPRIKVKINSDEQVLEVVPSVKITVNGEAASLYDLRVGDSVKVTIESGAVLKIETTAAAVSGTPISGTVEVVNKSKGFIKVNGETIFCKDEVTTFVTANGTTKSMKDLTEGAQVSIRGVMNNGAYTASLIVIE